MSLQDYDQLIAASVGLEVDGHMIKSIKEVSGITIEHDAVEVKVNTADGKFVHRTELGRPKSGQVTFTAGVSGESVFSKWMKDAQLGKINDVRTDGAVVYYTSAGEAFKRVKLFGLVPIKHEFNACKAGDTAALDEKLTLKYSWAEVE
jgi:phage tail-like protein